MVCPIVLPLASSRGLLLVATRVNPLGVKGRLATPGVGRDPAIEDLTPRFQSTAQNSQTNRYPQNERNIANVQVEYIVAISTSY